MMRVFNIAGAALVPIVLAGTAFGLVNPFTEDFDSGSANWRQADATTPMTWSPSGGGLDDGPYASAVFNFVSSGPGSMPAVARGQDSFDSSNDAFVGDWLGAGVTTFSFDVRQDSGVSLSVFARIATSANFPGAGAIAPIDVPSGVWTTISFPIDPGTWTIEGPFAFDSIFGAVGNIQIGAMPGPLANTNQVVTFDLDKVSITPTPGALALAAPLGVMGLRRRRR